MAWNKHEGCTYYTPKGATAFPDGTCSLAGFDLDSTLILSDKGDKYSKGITDWVWAYPDIPKTLTAIKAAGYTIVIFSNRKGPPWENIPYIMNMIYGISYEHANLPN